MKCKEAEKMIPLFLEDELETEELREFMEHIDKCDECKEELSIQFLVSEGIARLETGNVFDLQNELKGRMEDAGHALHFRENLRWILVALQGLVVLAIIIIVVILIFL